MSELTALPKGSLILVTGANGYIGAQVINTLLELGYRVRGTVRSEKPFLNEHFSKYGEGAFEQIIAPHLDDKQALGLAMTGVSGVALVASDVSLSDDPQKVIPWVVKSTETALAAAAKHPSIKRVVLTSSAFAAVGPQYNKAGVIVDEGTWNHDAIKAAWDPNTPKELKPGVVYATSKAEGERAAWKWVEEHKPDYVLNTILPNFNTGEILHPEITGSTMKIASDLLKGQGTALQAFMPQYYVDVVDVARLHAIALLAEPVKFKRIWGSAKAVNVSDFIDVLHELRPDNDKLIPEKAENEGRDLSELPPAVEAEKLLQKYFGQKGWTPFKESIAAGIRSL